MARMKQHYKNTPHRELARTHSISRMLISFPNILAITGGVSSRQKEGNDKSQFGIRQKNMALSPMTASQPQCSAVYGLATFSHVNKCEKTTDDDRGHFAVFVRIRRHRGKLAQPCLKANLQEPLWLWPHMENTQNQIRCLRQKEGNTPHNPNATCMRQKAENTKQMPMADGTQRPQANSTNF